MPNKKVLMAEFSDIRYDARVLKQADTLARTGYFVHLIMYNSSTSKSKRAISNNIEKIEIPFKKRYSTRTRLDKILRIISFFNVFAQYFFRLLFFKADYYHAHNYFVGWIIYLSSLIHGGKFIYDCHEIIWTEKEYYHKFGVYIERFLLLKASLAICPSSDRTKLIKDYYGLKKNLIPLYNYPLINKARKLESNILKNELGAHQDTNILLYTGMLSVRTRLQDNIIKSLPSLPDNVIFVMIGFGHPDEISYLSETANKYNIKNRLFILPPKPYIHLKKYIECADIGISLLKDNGLANRYHALNKFYDYVSCGIAVLASNFPSFRKDILKNPVGPIGRVCDEENPVSISDNIRFLIEDAKRLESFKNNAMKLHKYYWNWEKQAKILVDSYNKL